MGQGILSYYLNFTAGTFRESYSCSISAITKQQGKNTQDINIFQTSASRKPNLFFFERYKICAWSQCFFVSLYFRFQLFSIVYPFLEDLCLWGLIVRGGTELFFLKGWCFHKLCLTGFLCCKA